MAPRFAHVTVQLTGTDGNAFAVLGAVQRAMRDGGADEAAVSQFHAEATSGDYDNLLAAAMRWVVVS